MIEQTDLIVNEWHYLPPYRDISEKEPITSLTSLDVQKKRTATKKGIACRFNCRFSFENETILDFVAGDTYVIDLDDKIDKAELLKMIRNSFSKFNDAFEFRKMGTILYKRSLKPLSESMINLDAILPLLV